MREAVYVTSYLLHIIFKDESSPQLLGTGDIGHKDTLGLVMMCFFVAVYECCAYEQ